MLHKKTGFLHLYASLRYGFDGFMALTKETAFKHEVIFLCIIFVLFAFLSIGFNNYIIAVMFWLMLITTEAINTAIEHIVDKISPEISDFAKKTKDLASFAVFCMVLVNAIFVGTVVLKSVCPHALDFVSKFLA